MLADDVMDCDVLFIGSGGSGGPAAIETSHYGDTAEVSKTLEGKGGCTQMSEGGYNAVMQETEA